MTETIQQKTKHESRLMAISGVVSVGIGQDYTGKSDIIIGVESPDKLDKM